MQNLIHLFDKATTFSDLTIDMNNYDVATNALALDNAADYLYTGLYKQFKNLFISVKENTIAGAVTFEYYNGTTWESLTVSDETVNLTRSGFISWDLPTDWDLVTIDGKENYYIRITGDVSVELNGVNMVFSNDADLREHYRQILEYLGNDVSFVALHQASRKDIIQKIRNGGKTKVSSIDGDISDLTIWDFLEPGQLRNASAYLTLSKIFTGVSDNSEGKFFQLSSSFRKEYKDAVDTFLMSVDFNDNGEQDANELDESVNITRIVTL